MLSFWVFLKKCAFISAAVLLTLAKSGKNCEILNIFDLDKIFNIRHLLEQLKPEGSFDVIQHHPHG